MKVLFSETTNKMYQYTKFYISAVFYPAGGQGTFCPPEKKEINFEKSQHNFFKSILYGRNLELLKDIMMLKQNKFIL